MKHITFESITGTVLTIPIKVLCLGKIKKKFHAWGMFDKGEWELTEKEYNRLKLILEKS